MHKSIVSGAVFIALILCSFHPTEVISIPAQITGITETELEITCSNERGKQFENQVYIIKSNKVNMEMNLYDDVVISVDTRDTYDCADDHILNIKKEINYGNKNTIYK